MTRLPFILAMILLLPTACATTDNTARPNAVAEYQNTDPETRPTADENRMTLGLGQSTQLSDGGKLIYSSLINDSRCAPNVQCVWAGDAEIAIRWKPARGGSEDIRLHTSPQGGPTHARIGERTLTLISLERGIGPKAVLSIQPTP